MPSATAADVYINEKVPYAFDYADNDCNVYPAYSTHGTHVAGIIAGRDDDKTVGEAETFIGVAPKAQLVICKVFTDDLDSEMLGGADTADILAAVDDCATLGVDVINMSLGSSGGFSSEETDAFLTEVYNHVEDLGISLVVAAGNESSAGYGGGNGMNLASNPDSGTVGSPSTYAPALSVASINGQESPYFIANPDKDGGTAAFVTNAADMYSNDVEFVDLMLEQYADLVDASGNLELNYVVVGGVGRSANYTATVRRALADGRTLALVKRGDITFSEKIQNAMDAGAIGVIVYNNLSGEIRMSLADVENPVPTCSIDLNAGTAMVNDAVASKGKLTINKSFTAGPFMSSFSGLGVTPDLKLKPEITAHGGEILSAVPGGYDTYSGTSMAAPNMAGAVALLRQYIENKEGLEGQALNAKVNQLLMSTATIARNPLGNPYSPRKQGAGLADVLSAVHTPAYLRVPDGKGGYLDKTKIEWGDDVEKSGTYTATFTVTNESDAALRYAFDSYVFTETLAINNKTVEENAFMLDDASVTFTAGDVSGTKGTEITVPAGASLDITVTVTLTEKDKQYIDDSFQNGMYVEGYFRLVKQGEGNHVNLSVPFLGFYGDWSKAPMFDYSIYDLAKTDADATIADEDKPQASARATTPLGLYDDGQYIMPLGSFLYNQSEENVEIFPDSDKAAISMYDNVNRRTIYQLYMIYGGLLRGAKTLHITITDAVTGEVVYDETENNVRKAYANGGSNVGSPILIEMNPYEWGLNNNREYIFKMKGTLDWKDGAAENDTFEFNFHVDYEAPTIDSYSVRFEPYTENKETKYRIYLDVNVYDNQYVQSLLPCYVKDNRLNLMTEYVVPVYSSRNSITQVSLDITDFYDDYYDEIYLGVEDYAMNQSLYRLNLDNATKYCDTLKFAEDGEKFKQTDTKTASVVVGGETVRNEYGVYSLELAPNESYTLIPETAPEGTYSYKLDWSSGRPSVATAYENQIFAKSAGTTVVSVKDGNGLTKAQINVRVAGTAQNKPAPEKLTFRPAVNKDNFVQALDVSGTTLELYPNTQLQLEIDAQPWYTREGLELEWSSSNDNVLTVDANGVVSTHKKGVAYVTVTAVGYRRVSATLRIAVASEFHIVNYTLYGYYGGPDVVIPDELNVMFIDDETFAGNRSITSLRLPKTLAEIDEETFKNCTGLKTVYIPSETTVIGESAFEGCVSLETIQLGKFIDDKTNEEMTGAVTVAKRAFAGCTSLKTIENPLRLTTVGREAFAGCTSLETLDVSGLAMSYDGAFKDCTSLKNLTLSAFTSPAVDMFRGCTSLTSVTYPMRSVAEGMFRDSGLTEIVFTDGLTSIGAYAFENSNLTEVTVNGNVRISTRAFDNCAHLTTFTLSANARVEFAGVTFDGCDNFTSFEVDADNAAYSANGGVLYNKDQSAIVCVPYGVASVTLPDTVTEIGNGVFAGKRSLTSFDFGAVRRIGDYAFAETGLTAIVIPDCVEYIGAGAFLDCTALRTVDLTAAAVTEIADRTFGGCVSLSAIVLPANVTRIGDEAFADAGIVSADFGSVESIGDRAFYRTRLLTVTLPNTAAELGDEAFAAIPSLGAVSLAAVTRMGDGAFADCPRLATVTAGEGTTVIGDYAFARRLDASESLLRNVELSASVASIGRGAFYRTDKLQSIDLTHVEVIGDEAFMGSGLTSLDTAAVSIGDRAFENATALTTATLSHAQTIGVRAFYSAGLINVDMPAVTRIGANAFTKTKLTTVAIPSTLTNYSYQKTLLVYSQSKGRIEERKMFAESMGYGAFSDIATLTAITVDADNKTFFARDGVLYARVQNGYTLVQYPANKADESYTVLDGTVRIEADAFNSGKHVTTVVLPSALKSVGSRAFYASSVKDFTFRSVAAPVLDSTYVDASEFDKKDILYTIFATENNLQLGSQVFYANFFDYVAKITEERKLNDSGNRYTAVPFGLKITYPENGTGYDNTVWKAFFDTRALSDYAPDEATIRLNTALATLPTVDTVAAAATIDALEILAEKSAAARAMYNTINDEKQMALVEGYDALLSVEAAVRAARARLGAPATVASLKIASRPLKLRYLDGETFDPTGLKVIAVYSDTSEVEVTDYTLDKTTLHAGDDKVTVGYAGVTQTFDISVTAPVTYTVTFEGEGFETFTVTVTEGETVEKPQDPVVKGYRFDGWFADGEAFDFTVPVTGNVTVVAAFTAVGGGLNGGAIAGIVIGCVVFAAGVAVGVLFLLKRRKSADRKKQDQAVDTDDKPADKE